jgi:hypothetical protein
MNLRQVLCLALPALLLAGVAPVQALPIYNLNDTTNGLAASASFQPVAGGFEMTVTNTEANTLSDAMAISMIQFTIGGTRLGVPTAFTELAGLTTDFKNPPVPIDVSPPTSAQHWPFSTSGSVVSLFNVGGAYGGQPNHLIVATGSTPNSSLTQTHLPSFEGPVNFFFADTMVPSDLNFSDITGVSFGFGTIPGVPLEPGTPGGNVPEPATLTLLGASGGISLLALAWRRRKKAAEVAG